MTTEDAFLADIREHPEDDAPRLIFADWIEENGDPDRADFIRVQVRRFYLPEGTPEAVRLRDRAERLLARHWDDWVRPIGRLLGRGRHTESWLLASTFQPEALFKFRRGFLYLLDIEARQLLDCAEELFRLAPVHHVRLFGAGMVAEALAACPQLSGLSILDFADYYDAPLDAPGMGYLARSPHLDRLRILRLYNNSLGDLGVGELVGAGWLPRLVSLDLTDTGLSSLGVAALAAAPAGFQPERLRLGLNPIRAEGVRILASAPLAARLRSLSLHRCDIGPDGLRALASSPYLPASCSLDLGENPLGSRTGLSFPCSLAVVRQHVG